MIQLMGSVLKEKKMDVIACIVLQMRRALNDKWKNNYKIPVNVFTIIFLDRFWSSAALKMDEIWILRFSQRIHPV